MLNNANRSGVCAWIEHSDQIWQNSVHLNTLSPDIWAWSILLQRLRFESFSKRKHIETWREPLHIRALQFSFPFLTEAMRLYRYLTNPPIWSEASHWVQAAHNWFSIFGAAGYAWAAILQTRSVRHSWSTTALGTNYNQYLFSVCLSITVLQTLQINFKHRNIPGVYLYVIFMCAVMGDLCHLFTPKIFDDIGRVPRLATCFIQGWDEAVIWNKSF